MTSPSDALERAIEYFEQPKTRDWWEYTDTARQEIVVGLRALLSSQGKQPSSEPVASKREYFERVIAELSLDTRDPFTLLFANACALLDQRDDLKAEIRALHAGHAKRDASPQPSAQGEQPRGELSRLREIEHLAWHLLDSSEENATTGEVTIIPLREDYDKLSALLPESHPESASPQPQGEQYLAGLEKAAEICRERLAKLHPGDDDYIELEEAIARIRAHAASVKEKK